LLKFLHKINIITVALLTLRYTHLSKYAMTAVYEITIAKDPINVAEKSQH